MRTNIELNEKDKKIAMELTGLKTKKAIFEKAIKELIAKQAKLKLFELKGKVDWEGELNEMRSNGN